MSATTTRILLGLLVLAAVACATVAVLIPRQEVVTATAPPAIGSAPAATTTAVSAAPSASALATALLGPGRIEDGTFRSSALGRAMAFTIYLPPGYDTDQAARYPALYMLHGGSGLRSEWIDYGLLRAADRLMRDRAIAPFLIVLPQGDQEYWVDHVVDPRVGANGEKWGTYTAREVVPEIDRRYRTLARADARAIGGLSMGGHAAIQLALNFPGTWSVIGSHSPSIRPYGEAPTYLGRDAEFAARDPLSLIRAKPDVARGLTWWIDSGTVDPWHAQARAIEEQLTALGIPHEWHAYPGDHSLAYWSAHVEDYLRYHGAALCRRSGACR